MHLQDIYTYPIKSLGGIRLAEVNLEEKGLKYDRRWMLTDKNGQFLSQRKHPKMALLQTRLTENGVSVTHKHDPGQTVLIPFESPSDRYRQVSIWGDRVNAQLVDSGISRWFSDLLNFECDLVFMPSSTNRKVDPEYAVNSESVSFADGMPYLLIGQASLDDLNERLEEPVPMDRFRPNLVVADSTPFQEDEWDTIAIGQARFKITKPCARCVVTTVDQQTGHKYKEPLATLSSYRKVAGKVMFGQNMLLLEGANIRVGDSISVQARSLSDLA